MQMLQPECTCSAAPREPSIRVRVRIQMSLMKERAIFSWSADVTNGNNGTQRRRARWRA